MVEKLAFWSEKHGQRSERNFCGGPGVLLNP
jgi:hypothetical protein